MITPAELRDAAERLVHGSVEPDTEFVRRLAISRLYYAVFHELRTSAVARALPPGDAVDGGMHKAFITAVKRSPDRQVQRAGQRLADLHQRRVDADYNLGRNVSRMDVDEARHAALWVRRLTGLSA